MPRSSIVCFDNLSLHRVRLSRSARILLSIMPAYYRPFPRVYDNEIERYSHRPLPKLPTEYFFRVQSSASYESLLEHSVPSPSLLEGDEITKLWSRCLSHYSEYSIEGPSSPELSRSDSLGTISDSFDTLLTPDHRDRCESLLLPPPHLCSRRGNLVETRSFSTSPNRNTPTSSPQVSKRSATPTLLEELSSNLEELSIRPKTPVNSLATSQSLTTLCEDSPTTGHPTMDINLLSSRSTRKVKPSNIALGAGTRNISPPMPSPVTNNGLFGPSLAGAADSSYQECRVAPLTPDAMQEVSCIEWDDDEKSRLTRMKKSFTDLRSAGRTKTSTSPPSQARVKQISKPMDHHVTSTSPKLEDVMLPRQSTTSSASAAKLTKKPSIKVVRDRGWSHNSAVSDRSSTTKTGTPSSTYTTTALPRAESPHLTKRKRFSIAATSKKSGKGRKVSLSRVKRWVGRMFGC